jgi:hypothetical protein
MLNLLDFSVLDNSNRAMDWLNYISLRVHNIFYALAYNTLYFRILFQSIQVLSKIPVYESHDLTEVYRHNRETCLMQLQGLIRKWKQHQITLHHISGDNSFYGHCHTNFRSQCMNTF